MAFSGSADGRSGSVIKPAPSCLRLVREDEWLLLREPLLARLMGDEPVPVVIWLDARDDAGAEGALGVDVRWGVTPAAAVLDLGSA